MPMFTPMSDAAMIEAGWDPALMVQDPERAGPFALFLVQESRCPCCEQRARAWAVVDLTKAAGTGVQWTHAYAEHDAYEHAAALNAAWVAGYEERQKQEAAA